MTNTTPKFERVLLASNNAADVSKLAHLRFAMALGRDVIVIPEDRNEQDFWDTHPLLETSRGSFTVLPNKDQITAHVRPGKTLFCGADDRLSGFADRLGLGFLFVPTITDLPSPRLTDKPRKVAIVGPECSGKSTLAAELANALETTHVPEYARLMLDFRGTPCMESDLESLMMGQLALESSIAPFANGTLICDTEPRLSKLYAEAIYGAFPAHLASWLQGDYDQYILTSPDLPWIADGQRCLPEGGPSFFSACERLFKATGRPVSVISGYGQKRFEAALEVLRS